jgi:hypothetical protein
MSAKVVEMKFDLFEVSKINKFNSKEFINYLLSTNKSAVKMFEGSNGLPLFMITANDIKPSIKAFQKSKKNLIQRIFNI